ncbi:unnamed protein product [Protopolystoma xenopodis]|uniref:Uncharacterized protein n=1 Tax=Protopolystoma xenopodis TaxID=117903 RepID=A0A3S5CFH8_9PLAT|nr:unnamed protein product [Protopolystoma xenopodis]
MGRLNGLGRPATPSRNSPATGQNDSAVSIKSVYTYRLSCVDDQQSVEKAKCIIDFHGIEVTEVIRARYVEVEAEKAVQLVPNQRNRNEAMANPALQAVSKKHTKVALVHADKLAPTTTRPPTRRKIEAAKQYQYQQHTSPMA